jgi:hypothetical protein
MQMRRALRGECVTVAAVREDVFFEVPHGLTGEEFGIICYSDRVRSDRNGGFIFGPASHPLSNLRLLLPFTTDWQLTLAGRGLGRRTFLRGVRFLHAADPEH